MKTIAALRALLHDGGPAAEGHAYADLAEHGADPIAFAAREFLDTIAEHRHTLSSEHRRHLDRIAGNIRKIADR